MPPKKDASAAGEALLAGFTDKETKLIAAASVSSIGPDKYDWEIMHELTGFTVGTLKKFWPPVKKKVAETHPSFATFIGAPGAATGETKPAAAPKGKGKRKAADEGPEDDAADAEAVSTSVSAKSNGDKPDTKTKKTKKAPAEKKAPAKSRAKRVKKEEVSDEGSKVKSAEDSSDGGDGLAAAPEIEDEV